MTAQTQDRRAGTALPGLTKAGLWYIYSSTPSFWVKVARGFGLKIEPSDWAETTLQRAEIDAAGAVRFIPIPLLVCAVMLVLSAWWRPIFSEFLTSIADEGFIPLVQSAPMAALGHDLSQTASIALITAAVWLLSLSTVLVAFTPVRLAFRHQVRVAAPVVSVALASLPEDSTAPATAALEGCPRVRYALGKLQSRPARRRGDVR